MQAGGLKVGGLGPQGPEPPHGLSQQFWAPPNISFNACIWEHNELFLSAMHPSGALPQPQEPEQTPTGQAGPAGAQPRQCSTAWPAFMGTCSLQVYRDRGSLLTAETNLPLSSN